jgi:hypothetical protein
MYSPLLGSVQLEDSIPFGMKINELLTAMRFFFSRGSTVLGRTLAASHVGGFLSYLDIW